MTSKAALSRTSLTFPIYQKFPQEGVLVWADGQIARRRFIVAIPAETDLAVFGRAGEDQAQIRREAIMPFRQVNEQMRRQMTAQRGRGSAGRCWPLLAIAGRNDGRGRGRRSIENKRMKWPDHRRKWSDQTFIMG